MSYVPFNKKFITPHELTAQLERFKEILKRRDEIDKQPWIDTVAPEDADKDESTEP